MKFKNILFSLFYIFALFVMTAALMYAALTKPLIIYEDGEIKSCGFAPLPTFEITFSEISSQYSQPFFTNCIPFWMKGETKILTGLFVNPVIIFSSLILLSLVLEKKFKFKAIYYVLLILAIAIIITISNFKYIDSVGSLYFKGEKKDGLRYLPTMACKEKYLSLYKATPIEGVTNEWQVVIDPNDGLPTNSIVRKLTTGECVRDLINCPLEENCSY